MPHLLTSLHDDISICKNINNVDFNFIAKNKLEDKICVSINNKKFLLTKQIKNNKNLIKLDQATRVTPIYYAKQALNAYADICNADLLFSNTANNDNKLKPKQEYLKDISYFVDEFNTKKDICVEVGFGSGRHLLYQAQENPDILYIGLEIHTPSIEQMLKQIKLLNITNVLAVNYDARLFLEFLSSNKVSKIFVHFPVPWDKKPHRRVMSEEFIEQCLRVLKINASLELRTDSINYYEYSKDLLTLFPSYKNTILKNNSLKVSSKYEDRWKKQGKDIWDIKIYSNENSNEIIKNNDFSFNIKNNINFKNLEKNILTKPIVKDGYFVHMNKVYISSSSIALLSLTMGSFTKPLSIYIILQDKEVNYFINKPIPTSSNFKAHTLISNILNGIEQ